MVVSFIGGGNQEYLKKTTDLPQVTDRKPPTCHVTDRKPPTCHKSLTELFIVVASKPHHEWDSNLVAIGTDYTGSCKSNYPFSTYHNFCVGRTNILQHCNLSLGIMLYYSQLSCTSVYITFFSIRYKVGCILIDKQVLVHIPWYDLQLSGVQLRNSVYDFCLIKSIEC
jgi:hypothetical protein